MLPKTNLRSSMAIHPGYDQIRVHQRHCSCCTTWHSLVLPGSIRSHRRLGSIRSHLLPGSSPILPDSTQILPCSSLILQSSIRNYPGLFRIHPCSILSLPGSSRYQTMAIP
uniref:(northern house mosquito) hypothetical protein n=1 Tax=Culex pipiens TaxID=7175 RepID=A0A8D8D404_CULPI